MIVCGYLFLNNISANLKGPMPPIEINSVSVQKVSTNEKSKALNIKSNDLGHIKPLITETDSLYENLQNMDSLDRIISLSRQNSPTICQIICAKSTLNKEKLKSEGLEYFKLFFDQEQNRAFEDIEFRLLLEKFALISDLMPKNIRDFALSINKFDQMSSAEKTLFVIEAEIILIKYSLYFNSNLNKNTSQEAILKKINTLHTQCTYKDHTAIEEECQKLLL